MKSTITILMAASLAAMISCSEPKIRLGVVCSGTPAQEAEAKLLAGMAEASGEARADLLTVDSLPELSSYDVVWYHRCDTTALSDTETGAGAAFRRYVAEGGRLVLSMDGVRLLNAWGLEPRPIETFDYAAVDTGFGRKIGFHAFRSHPLFDGMFGGAYPWHGKEDNVCRLHGFTGDALPEAEGARVIGTLWEYIFIRPERKLVWEMPLGRGSILAVGGCLYYGRPNFHAAILERFTLNCLRYMHGTEMESPVLHWDFTPATVSEAPAKYRTLELSRPVAFARPAGDSIVWQSDNHYVDLGSRRQMIVGGGKAGIEEIWTHPFLSVRDFNVRLELEGCDRLVALAECASETTLYPHAWVRRYRIGDVCLTETVAADTARPVTVVNYAWSGRGLRGIVADFKCNLRYMWPYDERALGSIRYRWSPELNAFVAHDANREFVSLVGANLPATCLAAGQYDGFGFDGATATPAPTERVQVACALRFDVEGHDALDVVLTAGSTGEEEVVEDYAAALKNPAAVAAGGERYYARYLADKLQVATPDPLFDEAYRWALIGASQFVAHTPGVGTSLMAGYASSRRGWGGGHPVSGRPGYAWYFGRDAVWAALAFDAAGDFATVRAVLENLAAYQQTDGKIYHELTTSGIANFDAADATPLYVILMAHYLRASGDTAFVRRHIDAVHKAIAYCYSTDTDGDGLIENTHVGHGWLEGGALYGSHTEFYLAGAWLTALREAAYLAETAGDEAAARRYAADARALQPALEAFWNPEGGYYNYGKFADGSYTQPLLTLTATPICFGGLDPDRTRQTAARFSEPEYSLDWGTRTASEYADVGEEGAYGPKHVWPLFTGMVSLADYRAGLHTQGYAHLRNNMVNYRGMAPGRMPEVINGFAYRNNGITLHQCWSETMCILPLVEGLIGFTPDAPRRRMDLSPRLPFDWPRFEARNLTTGDARTDFSMRKTATGVSYRFASDRKVGIDFAPLLPPATVVSSVSVDGAEVPFETTALPDGVTLRLAGPIAGTAEVVVVCREGPAALASVVAPRQGEPSSGFRVLEQRCADRTLTVEVAGRSGSSQTLELYLPQGFRSIEGARSPRVVRDKVVAVTVDFAPSEEKYARKEVVVTACAENTTL